MMQCARERRRWGKHVLCPLDSTAVEGAELRRCSRDSLKVECAGEAPDTEGLGVSKVTWHLQDDPSRGMGEERSHIQRQEDASAQVRRRRQRFGECRAMQIFEVP